MILASKFVFFKNEHKGNNLKINEVFIDFYNFKPDNISYDLISYGVRINSYYLLIFQIMKN